MLEQLRVPLMNGDEDVGVGVGVGIMNLATRMAGIVQQCEKC